MFAMRAAALAFEVLFVLKKEFIFSKQKEKAYTQLR